MPHVVVKLFPGRTDEQKQSCAQKIVEALGETLGCPEGSVSVAFQDVAKTDWEKVYETEILGQGENLRKKPGYTMKNGEIVNN